MADGQAHNCLVDYASLRALIFESKNTGLPPGVTLGPGNPAQWIEVPLDSGPMTLQRVGVVAIRP